MKNYIFTFFIIISAGLIAQNPPSVKITIDRDSIKIGEQVQYTIWVNAPLKSSITLPDGQTFQPFEMVFQTPIDTLIEAKNITFKKTYFLTQFTEGDYTIDSQNIVINKTYHKTETKNINVIGIKINTSNQPLESIEIKPIKNILEVSNSFQWTNLLIITILSIGLILFLFLFFKKKKQLQQNKIALLPPFERAITELKLLQSSKLLIESQHKEYYTQLTHIIREYLEEEVHISATESTTDELISKIELLLDSHYLNLPKDVIIEFKQILRKSDLVKFAKAEPEPKEAESDTQSIEQFLIQIKEALPEPSQEDKLKNANFIKELQKQKLAKRKKVISLCIGLTSLILMLGTGSWFYYYENFISKTSKEYINKKNWVTSVYGIPPVKITTPDVLQRQSQSILPMAHTLFTMGDINKGFTVDLISFEISESQAKISGKENDFIEITEKLTETYYKGTNIITQHEPYTTTQGIEGLKISGSFEREINNKKIKMNYQNFIFGNGQNFVLLNFTYPWHSRDLDQELINKIIFSLQFIR